MTNFSCGHQPWMGISCVECRPNIYTKDGKIAPHVYWEENNPCPSCARFAAKLKDREGIANIIDWGRRGFLDDLEIADAVLRWMEE